MNTCSHTSIFRLLEIGPGGVRCGGGDGVWGVALKGFGLAFIKTPIAVSAVTPRCLG